MYSGQTGSGKTFSMIGPTNDKDEIIPGLRGILPRSLEHSFARMSQLAEAKAGKLKFLATVSFLEIYNERIFDLLDSECTGLQLREDVKTGVHVQVGFVCFFCFFSVFLMLRSRRDHRCLKGLTETPVDSATEAVRVLLNGSRNRRVAETAMNRESSRSHAVFRLTVKVWALLWQRCLHSNNGCLWCAVDGKLGRRRVQRA
jgi:kinesin family protein 15